MNITYDIIFEMTERNNVENQYKYFLANDSFDLSYVGLKIR